MPFSFKIPSHSIVYSEKVSNLMFFNVIAEGVNSNEHLIREIMGKGIEFDIAQPAKYNLFRISFNSCSLLSAYLSISRFLSDVVSIFSILGFAYFFSRLISRQGSRAPCVHKKL